SAQYSVLRSWFALLAHCLQRQARARQMVWIALGLLGFTAALIAINTAGGRWGMANRRYWMKPYDARPRFSAASGPAVLAQAPVKPNPGRTPDRVLVNYDDAVTALELTPHLVPGVASTFDPAGLAPATALLTAVGGTARGVLDNSGFYVFS